jgi:hypothetical protein
MHMYIYNDEQVKDITERIAYLTDQNHHTESLLVLATFLHEHNLKKALSALLDLHEYKGHLSSDLYSIRQELSRTLFYILEHSNSLSQDNKEKIKKAF